MKKKKIILLTLLIFLLFLVGILLVQLYRLDWKFFKLKSKFCFKSSQCISKTCCCPGMVSNVWYPFNSYGFNNPQKSINGRSSNCIDRDCIEEYGSDLPEVVCNYFLCGYKGLQVSRF